MEQIVFLILSAITLSSGWQVVTQRNLVRAALFLVLSLAGVAGLFALLEAGFLAVVQIFIYAGAIAILILFAVMLTRRVMDPDTPQRNTQWAASVGLVGLLLVLLVLTLWPDPITTPEIKSPRINIFNRSLQIHLHEVTLGGIAWREQDADVDQVSIASLGRALVDSEQYVVPFEVASVLLLVAMIGAVYIVFPRAEDSPQPGESGEVEQS